MRRHALTDAAFAALGAGRPAAATLAELRRAQLGRHLLLLREIARAAPAQTRHWYGELAVAQHTHPAGSRAVLADPLCGVWAAHCLRSLRAGRSPQAAGVDHLATLVTNARTWTATGAKPGSQPPDAGPHVPRDASGGRWLTATRAGLVIEVRLEDVDPQRARLGLTPTGRLTGAQFAHWQACLDEAWRLLVDRHRPDAEILAAVLEVIVPVEPDPAARGISATSADAFGAVAMSRPEDGTALAVGLLHEIQHSLLNTVGHLLDLHTRPDSLGYSPWRDDPRPASGILHGAYAYLAVTRFWRAEAHAEPGNRLAAFEFARWREAVSAATEGLLTDGGLTPAGTRFGTALRDEVRPWLDEPVDPDVARLAAGANADHRLRWRLRNRVVDPAAARALADTWRHGSARPGPAPAARLVPAARRALERNARLDLTHRLLSTPATKTPPDSAGTEPPPDLPGTEPPPDLPGTKAPPDLPGTKAPPDLPGTKAPPDLPGAEAPLDPAGSVGGGNGESVPLSDAWAGGRATAGDVAYLRGDYGTALWAYRKGVMERPGDDAAWAGLVLVSGRTELGERLEVVAAAYRALDDPGVDPVAFAAWIGS